MAKKYFGTDGIRGRAGEGKLSKETIAKLGLAIGRYLQRTRPGSKVVIGRDTRTSGLWIENLLITGLISHGIHVKRLGILPTAATSYLTLEEGASLGMMVTASHNPAHDNGIKFFGPDGRKFGDATQEEIESLLETEFDMPFDVVTGNVVDDIPVRKAYLDMVVSSVPKKADFSNLTVVLDCANGAGFETAPAIIRRLGVKSVVIMGDQPNGQNINKDCGSTHPGELSKAVLAHKADIGIALDGDADRLIMCDENGDVINGDQSMAALTLSWRADGILAKPALVATVMSNLGLERLMKAQGLELIRTKVGDRHVAKVLNEQGYNLGGEQSGHMLMPDYLPTGDGMLAAIQVLSVLVRSGKPASQALQMFEPVPQLLVNVRYNGVSPLERNDIKDAIKQAETEFGDTGRLLIRASGTEPVIRIMTEGDDPDQVKAIAEKLADKIRS